jgi:phage repressor protein C with HTH and peptisase S24 domain
MIDDPARLRRLDSVRQRLLELVKRREPPTDLKKCSLLIGKNHAYLHQFVYRGTPRRLPEEARFLLAEHLGCDEADLRPPSTRILTRPGPPARAPSVEAPAPATPERSVTDWPAPTAADVPPPESQVSITELHVRAAAGGGTLVESEAEGTRWFFPAEWLRHEIRASATDLRMITIDGDSMEPLLRSGDKILIDTARRAPSPPGVFVLFDGLGLVAKQLELVPQSDPPKVLIKSANPRYETYERTAEEVSIVGRVVWFARRM